MSWLKWLFAVCLVLWAAGAVAMMGPVPALPAPFDQFVRPAIVHALGGLALALGLLLLIRWMWIRLYS